MPPTNDELVESLIALGGYYPEDLSGAGQHVDYEAYRQEMEEKGLPSFTYSYGPEWLFDYRDGYERLGPDEVAELQETVIPGLDTRGVYGVQRHHMDPAQNALAASQAWKEYLAGGPLKGVPASLADALTATYRSGSDAAGHYGSQYADRLWSEQGVQGTMEDYSQYQHIPDQTLRQWMGQFNPGAFTPPPTGSGPPS